MVAELIKAGLSVSTALAMEAWKAQEVLDLLRAKSAADQGPRFIASQENSLQDRPT